MFANVSLLHARKARIVKTPEKGEYTLAKLTLNTATKDKEGPTWTQIAFRDDKGVGAWLPLYSPAIDAKNIKIKDNQISGYIQDQSPAHIPGVRFVYNIQAKVEAGKISGTWKRTKNKPDVMFRDKWSLVLEPASGTQKAPSPPHRPRPPLQGSRWQTRHHQNCHVHNSPKQLPPHPNTTSYGPCMLHPVVDGRIFIRGHDAIYCYDLRK